MERKNQIFYSHFVRIEIEIFLLIIYYYYYYYESGLINVIQMITMTILSMITIWRLNYMAGQLFRAMKYLLFIIEFNKIRSKEILQIKPPQQQRYGKQRFILHNYRFQREYVQLFTEINIHNQSIDYIFLDIETISKIAIIFGSLFFSKQIEMNFYNTLCCVVFMAGFIYSNVIYSCVVQFPYYNQLAYRRLIDNLATLQWNQSSLSLHYRIWQKYSMIRLNLFSQTMARNNHRFGYSCGHLFFITRYKFIELFLMNFVLILLFYKKFCIT
ncbi:hypothetical protein HUG17_6748 [Dermatophagoides farinae]|uniref:Uncharacterized protein n=1 Tax=Dermatophagoides farinae TaxID=6954 RepID=A0A9D4P516_DERFA|nr:hypothetical protein HUG17_6748 [Dermatophagoides farinae]